MQGNFKIASLIQHIYFLIDQVKYIKRACKRNWTAHEYHAQEINDTTQKTVNMFCSTAQFPALEFCGTNVTPHGMCELINHYHLCSYTKIGHGKCSTWKITCLSVKCTNMLYKPWDHGVHPVQQPRSQPVSECAYWPVLGKFNNCNIIKLANKTRSSEESDKIHKVSLDGTSKIWHHWCSMVNMVQ